MTVDDVRREFDEQFKALPIDLQADWRDTNHYEITRESSLEGLDDYFWLTLSDINDEPRNLSTTVTGRRLGLIMDAACWLPRAVLVLLKHIDEQAARIDSLIRISQIVAEERDELEARIRLALFIMNGDPTMPIEAYRLAGCMGSHSDGARVCHALQGKPAYFCVRCDAWFYRDDLNDGWVCAHCAAKRDGGIGDGQ